VVLVTRPKNHTLPSARAKVALRLLFTPRILPSSAEEGSFSVRL